MKYTRGGVLLLVKLQALACSFAKIKTPPWVFFAVLNCGDKLREASHMSYGLLLLLFRKVNKKLVK